MYNPWHINIDSLSRNTGPGYRLSGSTRNLGSRIYCNTADFLPGGRKGADPRSDRSGLGSQPQTTHFRKGSQNASRFRPAILGPDPPLGSYRSFPHIPAPAPAIRGTQHIGGKVIGVITQDTEVKVCRMTLSHYFPLGCSRRAGAGEQDRGAPPGTICFWGRSRIPAELTRRSPAPRAPHYLLGYCSRKRFSHSASDRSSLHHQSDISSRRTRHSFTRGGPWNGELIPLYLFE